MGSKNSYISEVTSNKTALWKDNVLLLRRLDMELTERCNNNCVHCCINLPADDNRVREKELSTGEAKRVLKEAASLGCLSVKLTGGEPLLREDFEEIYIFARSLGLRVFIFTNATLITPGLAKVFRRFPPLEDIEITVYGMKRISYEAATRSPGSFEAAFRGINLLIENKIPFWVKSPILPANKDEMDELEAWVSGVSCIYKEPSYAIFFDLRGRREEEKNEAIKNLRLSPEEALKVLNRKSSEYIKEMRKAPSKFIGLCGDRLFSCGAGRETASCDAYGNFQACLTLRHPDTVYNLKKGTLGDALKNFFPKIRKLKAKNPEYLARCARCFLKGLCDQCPAKSWAEHGTLDTPVEYFCRIAHAQARHLGLLKEGEVAWKVTDWKKRPRALKEEAC
jgi:radical SAM protein with 4Fe4S-binding SPASM domain